MTCPDWRRLLAHRFDPALEVPAHWEGAEAHLAECAACRRAATAIDPTLVFRAAATWTSTPGESEAIRQAVFTLRRTADLESRTEPVRMTPQRTAKRDHGPLAAAALFALILAFQPSTTARNGVERPGAPDRAAAARPAARAAAPAIEGVDRPGARVYEWGADDLSVVMVVDESLDV